MQYLDESNNSNEGTESLSSASTSVNTQKIVNNLVISDVPVRDLKTTGQNVGFNPVTEEMEQPRYNGGPYQVAPPPPVQDLSERMLTLYLQHLGNSVYLMLIIALGFVYPLINALSYGTEKQEQSKEQFEIFMIIIHGISIIVLSVVLIRLTLRKSDEDRGHGEGLNFFLRIGAIVFCIGVIILNILRALEPVELLVMQNCSTPVKPTHICYYSLSVIFYALQTYFMFKYHKTSFLSGPNRQEVYILEPWIVKLCLVHYTGINLIHWMNAIMWEAVELFTIAEYQASNGGRNETVHRDQLESKEILPCNSHDIHNTFRAYFQPFLFPCVIEYSLIVSGIFMTLYLKVRDSEKYDGLQGVHSGETENPLDITMSKCSLLLSVPDNAYYDRYSYQRHSKATTTTSHSTVALDRDIMPSPKPQPLPFLETFTYLTKAAEKLVNVPTDESSVIWNDRSREISFSHRISQHNVGKRTLSYLSGFCILIIGIIMTAFTFTAFKKNQHDKSYRSDSLTKMRGVWTIPYLLGTIMAAYLCKAMFFKFRYELRLSHNMEQILLYASYFGNIMFLVLCIVADTNELFSIGSKSETFSKIINVAYTAMQIIQETVQSIFMFCSEDLSPSPGPQHHLKVGRAALVVLISINLTIWLKKSLLLKVIALSDQYILFYGQAAWCLLASIFMPLVVFYRFQSASILAEMWIVAYEKGYHMKHR